MGVMAESSQVSRSHTNILSGAFQQRRAYSDLSVTRASLHGEAGWKRAVGRGSPRREDTVVDQPTSDDTS